MISAGRLQHGDAEHDIADLERDIGEGRGDGNGDPRGVDRAPGVVLDKAPAVHGPSPMSEKRCAYWLGQGGRGRRAVPQESHMRVRMRVCAYMGSLYTPVHYVHPVRPFVSNGFRGRGDAGASVHPAPGHAPVVGHIETPKKTTSPVCTGGHLYVEGRTNLAEGVS